MNVGGMISKPADGTKVSGVVDSVEDYNTILIIGNLGRAMANGVKLQQMQTGAFWKVKNTWNQW